MPIGVVWVSWSYWANIMVFYFLVLTCFLVTWVILQQWPFTPKHIVFGHIWSLLVTFANPVLCFVILQELELVKTLLLYVTICDFL